MITRRAVCAATAVVIALVPATADARSGPGPVGGPRMGERGVIADPRDGALPTVSAPAWLIADATSGNVLAARDPHHRYRPASTQKTLLALTMAPRLDPTGSYLADVADTKVDGTHLGLVPGQDYSIDDLWYGLFLRSGNDAASALARAGADGDVGSAVRMMQSEAQRLQANDTTVINPSGLDADGQLASAYDLALWGRAALGREDLRHYFGTAQHTFRNTQMQKTNGQIRTTFVIDTQNHLLGDYPGALGVKSGYTTFAHNTLIAAARRNGRTVLVTLMATSRNVYEQARLLLDWGFAHPTATPVGTLVDPRSPAFARAATVAGDPATVTVPNRANQRPKQLAAAGAGLLALLVWRRRRVVRARR
jgi:D-alanyl-D-alanine carboxypeptidase (penicillin-binding protein 5/6)